MNDDGLTNIEIWGNIVLFVFIGLVAISMVRFHSNPEYKNFNLIGLITDKEGKISRPAVMELGAFFVLTWAIVIEVNRATLTEWLAGIYVGAFVLRAGHAAWMSMKKEVTGGPGPDNGQSKG